MATTGKVTGIVSNLVTVQTFGPVAENELCYIDLAGTELLAEVIKVTGDKASVQVFESTRGLKNGDEVRFLGKMLEVTLGPGPPALPNETVSRLPTGSERSRKGGCLTRLWFPSRSRALTP